MTISHVEGKSTIILVDSVINSGKTIVEFLERVRAVSETVRVVIVAGVVQADVMASETGAMARMLAADENAWLVALRVSKNKFTGKGGTDTGNRLFNTTRMD
jgi:hypoxanthine phosphoribosyltransferase